MSLESDDVKFIRDEVKRQLNIILSAQAGKNDSTMNEEISNLYQNQGTTEPRPVMHPFGFVSRAYQKCFSVVAKMGAGPENRFVMGHRDGKRPTDLDEGETKIYSISNGAVAYQVACKKTGVFLIGAAGELTPILLGPASNQFFSDFLDIFILHGHPSNGAPPANATDATNLKVQVIVPGKLNSTKQGGF